MLLCFLRHHFHLRLFQHVVKAMQEDVRRNQSCQNIADWLSNQDSIALQLVFFLASCCTFNIKDNEKNLQYKTWRLVNYMNSYSYLSCKSNEYY